MTKDKGQSALPPTTTPSDGDNTPPSPARIIRVSRQGLSVTLPTAFWPRLFLTLIGVTTAVAGYVLYDIALDADLWDNYDDDDDE